MITIDATSSVPPFEQLRTQIVDQVRSAELAPGQQLPTVRRLAADLGVAPNTVARAYRELEAAGYVRTGGRRGTVVSRPDPPVSDDLRAEALDFAGRMRARGLSADETLRLVRTAYEAGR